MYNFSISLQAEKRKFDELDKSDINSVNRLSDNER